MGGEENRENQAEPTGEEERGRGQRGEAEKAREAGEANEERAEGKKGRAKGLRKLMIRE